MNPPVILASAANISGVIKVEVSVPGDYEVRLHGYIDQPTGVTGWWTWPTLLGAGTHTITGLQDGETYGVYAVIEDGSGNVLSYPSNIEKVVPFQPVVHVATLMREPLTTYEAHDVAAYRLRIRVVDAENMPVDIFLYQKEPDSGLTPPTRDSFLSVCSAADLEQFPAGAPQPGSLPPFYRLDWVDVVEEELETVNAIWTDINSAVRGLEMQLNDLEKIARLTRVGLHSGTGPEPSLSSVSLSSSSTLVFSSSSAVSLSSSSSQAAGSSSEVLSSSSGSVEPISSLSSVSSRSSSSSSM